MSKGPGRNIRETLRAMAARLRSSHAGERNNARRMILSICEREGFDPYDYGVRRYADLEAAKRDETLWKALIDDLFDRIDRAAPFIDDGCSGGVWRPSDMLKLVYCIAATGGREHAAHRAVLFVDAMLERARQLYQAGLHPDPWEAHPDLPLIDPRLAEAV